MIEAILSDLELENEDDNEEGPSGDIPSKP
jgi:hypothetical protein